MGRRNANYVQKMYRAEGEDSAVLDIGSGTSLHHHLNDLYGELKSSETMEAQIVKDADKLDCDLELREVRDAGSSIAEKLQGTREAVSKTLYTETARQMYSCIGARSSHEWHIRAKNRLTAGDWAEDEG